MQDHSPHAMSSANAQFLLNKRGELFAGLLNETPIHLPFLPVSPPADFGRGVNTCLCDATHGSFVVIAIHPPWKSSVSFLAWPMRPAALTSAPLALSSRALILQTVLPVLVLAARLPFTETAGPACPSQYSLVPHWPSIP